LRLRGTIVGFDALPSWAETHSCNMSTVALRFLKSVLAHKNREEKIKQFKVNQKENENLPSLLDIGVKILIELEPEQEK